MPRIVLDAEDVVENQTDTQPTSFLTSFVLPPSCPVRNAPPANQTSRVTFVITPWSISPFRPFVVQFVTRASQQQKSKSLKTMCSATVYKRPSLSGPHRT